MRAIRGRSPAIPTPPGEVIFPQATLSARIFPGQFRLVCVRQDASAGEEVDTIPAANVAAETTVQPWVTPAISC